MLEISRRADYAVSAMLLLGGLDPGERSRVKDIARLMTIPEAFLHKIAGDLVDAGLVLTQSGPKGGLMLAKAATQINLAEILEATEGPFCINMCLQYAKACPRDAVCPTHSVWRRIQDSIIEQLRAVSLAD